MIINIPSHIENMLIPNLLNWEKITPLIQKIPNDLLQVAHKTVETKLHFANMQLSILNQVYNPPSSFEKNLIKRSMFEGIIVNLVAALEAVAHVINQIYDLNVSYKLVSIDHKKYLEVNGSCLRCKVSVVNQGLGSLLDEFLKKGSPIKNWYQAVIEYRHQIVHRPHYIATQILGVPGYFIPDDPKIIQPKGKTKFDEKTKQFIMPNFTKMRELRDFSEYSFSVVLKIIDGIYLAILEDNKFKLRMADIFNF